MGTRFLGVPTVLWGVLCLVLAVVWVVIWPSDLPVSPTGVRYLIVRWFHSLVWLLLAVAAFVAAFDVLGGASTARRVALTSLALYLLFLGAVVTAR